jgi:hypothetical protein
VFLAWYLLEIGDEEAANQYRQVIADISDRDWRVGWADTLINAADGNKGGMREAWNWTSSRVPKQAQFSSIAAFLELAHGDPATARKIYLATDPDWTIPEAWARLIDRDPSVGCLVAWTLTRTGDETLGAALLDQTLAYFETLPSLVEHHEVWDPQFCYLMAGDTEKALTTIKSQLADNDLTFWKTNDRLPMYEQIRFEPRYQAATAEYERRIAEQRKAVEQVKTGTGL